jgi:hypothetical protein
MTPAWGLLNHYGDPHHRPQRFCTGP